MYIRDGKIQFGPLDLDILREIAPKELQRFLSNESPLPENRELPPLFHPVCIPLLMHPYASPEGVRRCYQKQCSLVLHSRDGREYQAIQIPKSDDRKRTVYRVSKQLTEYQRWIQQNILAHLPVHPCATAYKPGSSVKRNAAPHVGHRQLVKVDLKDYFGHISFLKVKKVFLDAGYSGKVSTSLAGLCTREGALPQGAVSSPALANLVFFRLDEQISAFCSSMGITYTRYCDDLCFSSDDLDVKLLLCTLRKMLSSEGYVINSSKTRALGPGDRHQITGVVSNMKIQAPSAYRKKIRQEMYFLRRYGLEEHLSRMGDPRFYQNFAADERFYLNSLLGRIDYVLFLNPEDREFAEYREEVASLGRIERGEEA